MSTWFLEGYIYQAEKMHRVVVDELPFVIGRGTECNLALSHTQVSRLHCTLHHGQGHTLLVTDDGSTNGTTVNGVPVDAPTTIQHGDVIALGGIELRLLQLTAEQNNPDKTVIASAANPHGGSLRGMREFEELMANQQVTAYFQAIFTAAGDVVAHEALGRGTHPNLPESPFHLFSLAASLGKQVALSEMLRDCAIERALTAGITTPLYLNTDASELANVARLIEHLSQLRNRAPQLHMVIEIHEEGVSSLSNLKNLAAALQEQQYDFAYDDFGAGRARLMELIEVPPSVLKLDLSLIRGIDAASDAHRQMLTSLISVAQSVGAKTLAEGVETAQELQACSALGIDLIQGYWLGKPMDGFQQQANH